MMSIIIVMAAFVQKCHFSETWAHHLRRCDVWLTLMKDEHFLWIRSILFKEDSTLNRALYTKQWLEWSDDQQKLLQ